MLRKEKDVQGGLRRKMSMVKPDIGAEKEIEDPVTGKRRKLTRGVKLSEQG